MDDSMMGMDGMDSGGSAPLNDSGVDFSNQTQAMDFLSEILDDTYLQVDGNTYARYFWYGIVVVIGLISISNIIWRVTLAMRIRAAAANHPRPATPKNLLTKSVATITALLRETSYPQLTLARTGYWFKIPPLGTTLILFAYLGFILALEFINNHTPGAQYYQALGIRAAWLSVAQVPLVILLAGKNNLIGLVTSVSYDRLNVFHRWVSRGMLLLATLHFGYQSYGWNQYGLMQLEWATDTCAPTGIAAYALLLWMNLTTFAPLRHFSYEFFVIQHLITFFGLIIAIMMHLPSTALYSRVYIYIPIALYLVDRIIRSVRLVVNNFCLGRATLLPENGGVTKIRIRNPSIKKWAPGSFVLLSIPRFGFAQSHPATIASIPTSHNGDMVFLLKSHSGFTKRIMKSCASIKLSEDRSIKAETAQTHQRSYRSLIDGPYGGSHANFASFDSVILIAGSTGITFILALLLDIAHRAAELKQKLPVHRVEVIWMVKSSACIDWVSEELQGAYNKLQAVGVTVKIRVHVTCDERFTSTDEVSRGKDEGCDCDKSLGPCCCIKPTATVTETGSRKGRLEYAKIMSGRPDFLNALGRILEKAEGETGIAVCGPFGLNTTVRNTVVQISDQRAVHKGTGAQGIYLHAEGFVW